MSDQSLDDIDELLGMALQKNIEGKVFLGSDLNSVPMPDYSDYASLYEQREFMSQVRARIFFEMSRGCYWGHGMCHHRKDGIAHDGKRQGIDSCIDQP